MALRRSVRVGASGTSQNGITMSASSTAAASQPRLPSKSGVQKTKAPSKASQAIRKRPASGPAKPEPPSTPRRSKKTKQSNGNKAPPFTPTPSAVGMMSLPYSSGDIDDATLPPPKDRPAELHRSNAPLISPQTARLVSYADEIMNDSPSKSRVAPPTTTTAHLLEEACAHLLKVDPKLKTVIEKNHCRIFSPEGLAEEIDPFRSLASGIIAQQVSGAAAKAIKNRFIALFNESRDDNGEMTSHGFPSASQVAACDIARLRSAGLSGRKAEYIQGLAEKFASGELGAQMLVRASDEEVLEKLTTVRGLGRWSVEMFACFGLKRLDVFSTGDLGVQRGMAAYMGRDVSKLKAKGGGKWKYMSEKEMLEVSEKFAPYRSLFMWYMWRIENVDVDAVENN